jgi:type VI secretion system secreted protein VgrG
MSDKATQKNRLLSITTPLGEDYLLLNRLTATEEISALFSFEVELMYDHGKIRGFDPQPVDPKSILGQAVAIDIRQPDGTTRTLSGIVNHFSQGHRDIRFSYYHATIVPQLWILTQKSQSRTFQHLSVPEILQKALQGLNVSYELQGSYKPRNYCVQYRETDFDFVSRLMEEEGIYYFFEHKGGKNNLVVADTPQSHQICPSKNKIPFALKVDEEWDFVTSITKWQDNHRLQSGKVTYYDFNFQVPFNKLDATQPTLYNVAYNDKLEIYDFPSGPARKYDDIDRGGGERADVQNVFDDKQKRAEIAMQSLDAQYRTVTGTSDCCALTAGHRFTFFNHPQEAQNGEYVITSVTHEVEQNPTYKTSDDIENPYVNSFSCIPHGKGSSPFRPVRKTPKPIVRGSQTAFVVGPAGEEIFTDKFGRVKVQFHWDRHGKVDSDSSCWIRVGQAWAGNRWGMMFIPRIGMEVIVEFLEGDPDQPIITGCVYNPETMPPYDLPAEKTKMTIKSNSSKGGNGFNEIRFEDKKGKEQIFIHAEKDEDIRVENNATETIIANRHLSVGVNQYETVGKDKHLKVGGDKNEDIGGSLSLTVGANFQETTGKKHAIDAGNEIHLKSGKTVVVEAGNQLTLKCGPAFITLKKDGTITIKGSKVLINSGGMTGSGSGSSPDAPTAPRMVDKTGAGKATGKKPPPPLLTLALVMAYAAAHAVISQKRSSGARKKQNTQAMINALVIASIAAAAFVRPRDSNSAKNKPK